jgi:hypothetical protein
MEREIAELKLELESAKSSNESLNEQIIEMNKSYKFVTEKLQSLCKHKQFQSGLFGYKYCKYCNKQVQK